MTKQNHFYVVFQAGPMTGAIELVTNSKMENFREITNGAAQIRQLLFKGDLSAPPCVILSWRQIGPSPAIMIPPIQIDRLKQLPPNGQQ